MTEESFHTPVLLKETIEGLNISPGKKYIDATMGGGGHAWEIVSRGGRLLGIDADLEALDFTERKFKIQSSKFKVDENWILVQGNFREIEKIAKENGFDHVEGILFDLGVSSHQLDTRERGFSYRFNESLLDLRLNQQEGESAASLINRLSEDELYEIFTKFGEEKHARTVAGALVRARHLGPINKVADLVKLVNYVVTEREKNAVLSRIFQALRIAVNDELENLKSGLAGAEKILHSGGRLVVLSFHSLEDRLVKRFMRGGKWKVLTKKPVIAGSSERFSNIRSRSAKLRIAEYHDN